MQFTIVGGVYNWHTVGVATISVKGRAKGSVWKLEIETANVSSRVDGNVYYTDLKNGLCLPLNWYRRRCRMTCRMIQINQTYISHTLV